MQEISRSDELPRAISLLFGLALWLTAINLFIPGHTIEGNARAMTSTVKTQSH